MQLHTAKYGGEGQPPLLAIHGLLGSSRNWQLVGRDLAERYEVHALDLRNHGASGHGPEMDFDTLVGDVLETADALGLERFTLVGHSLGGKVGMALACRHPERVERLVVADIAPRDMPAMLREFDAMLALDLPQLASRAEAEQQMAAQVPDLGMRRFLLTNLERAEGGGFRWGCNLEHLYASLGEIARNPLDTGERFEGPSLFVRGGQSAYVRDEDWPLIREHFPAVRSATLEEAGHNVHVEDRGGFVRLLFDFLIET